MNILELGAIGEMVGGVAVIGTLAYLAAQVRHASVLARTSAHVDVDSLMSSFLGDLARDADLHHIWYAGLYSGAPLDDEQRDRFGMLLYQAFGFLNAMHQASAIDATLGVRLVPFLDRLIGAPPVREWWSRQGEYHSEAFRVLVDTRIRALASAAPSGGGA